MSESYRMFMHGDVQQLSKIKENKFYINGSQSSAGHGPAINYFGSSRTGHLK